jgi:hypothetical protein
MLLHPKNSPGSTPQIDHLKKKYNQRSKNFQPGLVQIWCFWAPGFHTKQWLPVAGFQLPGLEFGSLYK